ncbi:MAG: hypothetical protein R6X12_03615 [bacterium]
MKILRTAVLLSVLAGPALAARPWAPAEFEAWYRDFTPRTVARPETLLFGPRRHNYLERIRLMADFVARHQVADSNSPDYGGIIEAEHMPNVIETDNTQEAIWVWSRWHELTGRDDYAENVRRAWRYVLAHPAYWEHNGDPLSLWYAVWNSGLALMAEARYRAASGDTSFRAYADSCRGFYLANPLPPTGYRDNFVTAQSSGMAYPFAVGTGDAVLRDSAVARGARVRAWIEEDAAARLAWQDWAMSGGTAFWGVANSVGRADTAAGRAWVATYAESLPGFYPSGTWNCSHNIWLANAYRAAAELSGTREWRLMHQYLVDTLLTRDTDRDGGIPANWTDPDNRDQTWVSTYLHFMGFEVFTTPTHDRDAAQLEFALPGPGRLVIAPDSVPVLVPVANVGLEPLAGARTVVSGPGYSDELDCDLPFLAFDTLTARRFPVPAPGDYTLTAAIAVAGDANPANDTSRVSFKAYGLRTVSGTLTDSSTAAPVPARLHASVTGDAAVWDSCETDPSGNYSLRIIDTTVTITARPRAPWYDRSWDFVIAGDTTIDLATPTAHLLLVNNDPAAAWQAYYTDALDALGVTWTAWSRPDSGAPPWRLLPELRSPTVVYYSGDAATGTVPADDRDSLATRAAAGLSLLLSGQDIAEELAGTPFLEDLCGVQFDSSGWARFFVFGNRADSAGRLIHAIATAGGDGAGNQRSRDMLSPLRNGAATLMVYDTTAGPGAAVRRLDPQTGSRIITLGFGFEAVNQPSSRPDLLTRPQFLARLLDWLGLATGVAEPVPPRPLARLRAAPNPFRETVRFSGLPPGTSLAVHDATGRRVALVTARDGSATWDGRGLPAGAYFARPLGGGGPTLLLLKLR